MRSLMLLTTLLALTGRGDACPYLDETFVSGGADDERGMVFVAPRPMFFVHIGDDSGPELPQFSTLDGRVLPTRMRPVQGEPSSYFVTVDIESGVVLLEYRHGSQPRSVYFVDPDLEPSTRSVKLQTSSYGPWLEIDSDAIVYRIERGDGAWLSAHDGGLPIPFRDGIRIIAIYSTGREEIIFDRPTPPELLLRDETEPATRHHDRSAESPWPRRLLLALAGLGALLLCVSRRREPPTVAA